MSRTSRLRILLATILIVSCVTTATRPALAQTPYLWVDIGSEPANMARGWFVTNGGNANNIMVSGTTTLNAAIGRLAAGDRIYTLAHGVSGVCARGGQSFVGGRISLEGADRRGFGAGTDPNNSCPGGGAPYALPNQQNFTWRMLTCNSGTTPGWAGGISVVASAQAALGNTVTISGADATQSLTMRFFARRGGGTTAQWAACVATFDPWAMANQGGRSVNQWYDATAFGNHAANLTALQNGPVAAYNTANGTTWALTRQAYIWTPAIPGTPPVLAQGDEESADEPDAIAECQDAAAATPVAHRTWGEVKLIYR
jgi:hypothetical protein